MTQITKLLGTTMTIKFHNIPPRKMEFLKDCITDLVKMNNKIIVPGQIIIHLDKNGIVMQIDVKAVAYKREKRNKTAMSSL